MQELVDMQRSILALYAPLAAQDSDGSQQQQHPAGSNRQGGAPAVLPLRLTTRQLKWRQLRLEDSLAALARSPGPLSAGKLSVADLDLEKASCRRSMWLPLLVCCTESWGATQPTLGTWLTSSPRSPLACSCSASPMSPPIFACQNAGVNAAWQHPWLAGLSDAASQGASSPGGAGLDAASPPPPYTPPPYYSSVRVRLPMITCHLHHATLG